MKNAQENLATLTIWSRNVKTSTWELTTCAWIRAGIWRQDDAICSKNRNIVQNHRCARITGLTVSVPGYGSCLKVLTHREEKDRTVAKLWIIGRKKKQQQKQKHLQSLWAGDLLAQKACYHKKVQHCYKKLNTLKTTDKETTNQRHKTTNNHATKKESKHPNKWAKVRKQTNKQTSNERTSKLKHKKQTSNVEAHDTAWRFFMTVWYTLSKSTKFTHWEARGNGNNSSIGVLEVFRYWQIIPLAQILFLLYYVVNCLTIFPLTIAYEYKILSHPAPPPSLSPSA